MNKKILLVEDSFVNAKLFNTFLRLDGYHVVTARTGVEALSLADKEKPDAIIMDLQLPDDSGTNIAKKIREDVKDVPMILVSAHEIDNNEALFCAHLRKPIDGNTLRKAVQKALSE